MRRERELGQTATFNAHRRLKINRQGLHCHIKNLLGGGKQTTGILANHGRAHGDHLRYLWVANSATRDFVALCVPGLSARSLVVLIIQNPLLCRCNEFVLAVDNSIDQTRAQCLFGGHTLALNNVLVGSHQSHEIHGFYVAAASGQQTQRHFGKAELNATMIPGDSVVAAERELETTT